MELSEFYDFASRGQSPEVFARWMLLPTELAAAAGELDALKHALEYVVRGGVTLAGYRGRGNRTLFDAAARGGNAGIVSILLERGAQPDISVVSCTSGKSALYLATCLKKEEVAKRLILGGADASFRYVNEKCDVLLKAVSLGLCSLVPLLLGAGASANTRGERDVTPLHVSAEKGFEEVTCILLANGADKDAFDDSGESPLMYAAHRGHFGVVGILMRQGVRVDVRTSTGRSLLHLASIHGRVELAKSLLDKGVDLEEMCPSGRTPLMFAAYHGEAGVTDLLLKKGANRSVTLRGKTPFMHAIIKGHRRVVETFVKNGENASDALFLRMAVGQNQPGSIFALVKGGADMEKTDENGYTSLMYSVCKPPGYKLSALTCLLRLGADASCKSPENERTPLHMVCRSQRQGFADAIDILLRRGADETICDGSGRTPLQCLDLGHGLVAEKERARTLLTQAPQDRAWRRRGWLVMARSAEEKAEEKRKECGVVGGESAPKVLRVQSSDKVDTDFVKVVEFLTGHPVNDVFRTVLKYL